MNRKRLIYFFCLFSVMAGGAHLNAQVSIGGESPQVPQPFSILELVSTPTISIGGLRLPQLTEGDKAAIQSKLEGNDKSKGLLIYNSDKSRIEYWDGTQWVTSGSTVTLPWQVSASTAPSDSVSVSDDIYHLGSVTLGSSVAPDPTAALNVIATNKGVLFPRVALSSTTDSTTIPSPTKGLLLFNTGEGGLAYTGYVFWDGAEWVSLTSGSLAPGTIGAITCNGVSITPSTYTAGTPYTGTMSVPYTGSNGGVYPAMTLGPVNGLTATLVSGNFTPGAGTLSFAITGTPTVTTPETTTFSLNIGGQTCDAVVGAGDGIAPGDLVFYQTGPVAGNVGSDGENGNAPTSWLSNYIKDLPVVGGKLRLDGYFDSPVGGSGTVSFNPRLVNISASNVKFWFSAMTTVDRYNAANLVLAPNSWVDLDNGIYSTWGANSVTSTATNPSVTPAVAPNGVGVGSNADASLLGNANGEVVTLDLSLDNKWYRIYYYMVVDNQDITPVGVPANCVRRLYLSIQRLY